MNTGSKADGAQPATRVVVLFGPTAVGKTTLLNQLFGGEAEVVNADSMQVYRGMDVGTAKPDEGCRRAVPHHLIDIVHPSQQFNVGDFVHAADALIPEIQGRGRVPVVSGGTAFYLRAFLFGLPQTPPAFSSIREEIERERVEKGVEELFKELKRVDPVTADRVGPADRYRIARALEVFRGTGRPLSSFRVPSAHREMYEPLLLGLDRPRQELYRRIDRRVLRMFEAGLIGEIEGLLADGCRDEDPGMRGIGYREVLGFRRFGCGTLSETVESIQRNTRRYAKRQLTFFRRFPGVEWFHPDESEAISAKVARFLNA